jgi:hypothetical protein
MPSGKKDTTVIYTLSSLGNSTGRNYFDGSELLIAVKCYFDGSEGKHQDGDTWVTLAGFATSDAAWKVFNDKWDRMLKERYPVAPYIHMWEIYSGTDPFERGAAGWDETLIGALVFDALNLLQQMDKEQFRSFVCSVNLSGRDRLISEGYEVSDPITLCVEMCVGMFMQWSMEKDIELHYLFFDRGEKFFGDFKSRWLKERTPLGKITPGGVSLFWDLIADIQEVDMERNPPIQAADMLAWGKTRSFSDKTAKQLNEVMGRVIPSATATITEEIMRQKSVKA